jgi:hypothetical protein
MKLHSFISLITLVTAFIFFTPGYVFGENNHAKNKNKKDSYQNDNRNDKNNNDNNLVKNIKNVHDKNFNDRNDNRSVNIQPKINKNNSPTYSYKYRGKYRNFRNYNHANRYYYNGGYYNFDDYYRHYSRDNNEFTYEGSYGRHSDIFIFSDRYGNEFDLYLKPVNRAPIWFKVSPIGIGRPYHLRVKPARYYPNSDEIQGKLNLQFGWGNLTIQNGKYIEMHSAPELINIRGRVYIRR